MAGNYPGNEICCISCDDGTTYSSNTYRVKKEDKRTGSYERFSAKDKTVCGEAFVDRSGREGYKDEYSETTTYKYGDKKGYTEISYEKKVKHVDYNKSSNNTNAKRSYPMSSSNNNYKRVKWTYDK